MVESGPEHQVIALSRNFLMLLGDGVKYCVYKNMGMGGWNAHLLKQGSQVTVSL